MMLTRSIPNKKILEIAIEMHCHYIVYRVDENRESRHQTRDSIGTHKNKKLQQTVKYDNYYTKIIL